MNVSATRYSTVLITGAPDPLETCERYLYGHTTVLDATFAPVFVLATTAAFDCADSEAHEAFERAKRTSFELRRYQNARFESGLHPTQVFATLKGAEAAAIDAFNLQGGDA